jgi:integrase
MNRPRKTDKHLPQCVYQKHGAFYLVKAGKWTRLGDTLEAALTEYARTVAGTSAGTMPQLIERVYQHHTPKLAKETRASYRTSANILKRKLLEFSPDQVKSRHVAEIRDSLAAMPTTANKAVGFLRVVFAQAVEWQLVDGNPCIGVKKLKTTARDRYIKPAEFSAIYAKAGDRLQVIMDLCYLTGQRIGDILRLRESDIGENGIYFKAKKTENSTQVRFTVAWTDELKAAVARARSMQGAVRSLTLLRGRTGKPPIYRSVATQWENACKAAGVEDAHLHDLRAKSLTDTDAQGGDAQALGGHADKRMTERYLRLRKTPVVHGPNAARLDGPIDKKQKT